MPTYGITAAGFTRPQLTDIQQQINQGLIAGLGADINTGPESVFAALTGPFAEQANNIWDAIEDVNSSMDPNAAFGASLDNLGSLRGIPRLGAMKSTIQNVKLFGTSGDTIPGTTTQFSVINSPTSLFALDADVVLGPGQDCIQTLTFSAVPASGQFVLTLRGSQQTIQWDDSAATIQTKVRAMQFCGGCTVAGTPVSGLVTITFSGAGIGGLMVQPQFVTSADTLETAGFVPVGVVPFITQPGIDQASVNVTAVSTGATIANAGTLTVIATPVTGLSAVLNVQDAVVGRAVESDNAYRARMSQELQIAGAGTVEAIRSRLLQVTGVTSVIVFENVSDITDGNGLPPHSFEAFVQGGAVIDIANAIWEAKPAGIQTYGTIEQDIVDSQGLTHAIHFSRPVEVDIYMIVNLTIDVNYPGNGDTTVTEALVNYINALGQGVSIIVTPKLISAIATIPGIEDAVILIGTAPAPTMSNNIPITLNEISRADTSRVTVNHV